MGNEMERRKALQALGLGAAALGGYTATAAGYAKNETLSVGVIGCGGRSRGALMPALLKIPGVRVDAVCDVYDAFLRSGHVQAGGRDRDVQMTRDYREVLDRKDIDLVVIGTPDHWHTPMTIDACEAGKDVYVEKPVTHHLYEGEQVIAAKNRTKRVVQVGAQQRTMPHIAEFKRRLDSGEADVGPVHHVHMQWNRNHTPYHPGIPKITEEEVDWKRFIGNAPAQPFDPYKMRTWRWFWDFGDGPLGDLMVHWLDCTNWLFDLPLPKRVVSIGDNYSTRGHWETPDTINTVFEYPGRRMQIDFECSFANDFDAGSMRIFGEKATVYMDRGRFEITSQGNRYKGQGPDTVIASEGPRGAGDYPDYDAVVLHMGDWLEAVRDRRDPVDSVEAGVQAAAVCHHGNIAYREKRLVEIG